MTSNDWMTLLFYFVILPLFGYSVYWLGAHGGDFFTKMKRRRHRCQNCHFLIKESPQLPSTSWNEKDREDVFPRIRIPPKKLEHGGWRGDSGYDMIIGCYKKIWTQEHNEMNDDNRYYRQGLRKEVTLNRGENCFFVPYYEGMPMENAEELFRDKSENRRTNKRILWAQIGSGLALATSIASIYLQLSK